jgi:hypothetical protein
VFRLAQDLNVQTTHGTGWQRLRRLLAPAFAPRRVAEMAQLMHEAIIDVHADALPRGLRPAVAARCRRLCIARGTVASHGQVSNKPTHHQTVASGRCGASQCSLQASARAACVRSPGR